MQFKSVQMREWTKLRSNWHERWQCN